MKTIIPINGKYFELCGTHEVPQTWMIDNHAHLLDCYDKPSHSKRIIWDEWVKWFRTTTEDLNRSDIGICSYNAMYFSIEGYLHYKGSAYYFYITYAHNRTWKIW